jgi:hypothetical protein
VTLYYTHSPVSRDPHDNGDQEDPGYHQCKDDGRNSRRRCRDYSPHRQNGRDDQQRGGAEQERHWRKHPRASFDNRVHMATIERQCNYIRPAIPRLGGRRWSESNVSPSAHATDLQLVHATTSHLRRTTGPPQVGPWMVRTAPDHGPTSSGQLDRATAVFKTGNDNAVTCHNTLVVALRSTPRPGTFAAH